MRAKREYFANNSPRGLIFAKRIRRLGGTASLAILAKITIIADTTISCGRLWPRRSALDMVATRCVRIPVERIDGDFNRCPAERRSRLTLEGQWLTFREHGFKMGMWRSLVRSGARPALDKVATASPLRPRPMYMSRLSRS